MFKCYIPLEFMIFWCYFAYLFILYFPILLSIRLKFENVDFPDSIGFECTNCGKCCKEFPGDLNPNEIKRIEEKGYKNFIDLSDPNRETNPFF